MTKRYRHLSHTETEKDTLTGARFFIQNKILDEMNPHIKVGWSANVPASVYVLLDKCVRTFFHYCNTNNTSTILMMEGIRAGWNKAF